MRNPQTSFQPDFRRRRPARLAAVAAGALAAAAWLTGSVLATEPRLEVYPATPGAILEERVAATIQSRKLPLQSRRIFHADSTGERFMEVAAGRFAAAGPVSVKLAASQGNFGQPVLRAVGRDWTGKHEGNSLAFELPSPGHYYLQLPGLAKSNGTFTIVFWVDDLRRLEKTRAQMRTPGTVVGRDHIQFHIQNLTVDWQGNEANWAGVVSGQGLAVSEARAPVEPGIPGDRRR